MLPRFPSFLRARLARALACAWIGLAGALPPSHAQESSPGAAAELDVSSTGEIEGMKIVRAWRFDRPGDSEGWQAIDGVAPLEVRDGALLVRNTGPDPQLSGPQLWTSALQFQFLALRCRASAPGVTQIYYSKDDAGFREEQLLPVRMLGDGQWHSYRIDLRVVRNWFGTIRRLRLDPLNGTSEVGARLEIDWIALYQEENPLTPLLPRWIDDRTLALGFECRRDRAQSAPIEFLCEGRPAGAIPCIESPGQAELRIDASSLPPHFWVEAWSEGRRIWRGRMVRPLEPAAARTQTAPELAFGRGCGVLARDERQRVRLAPLASLTLRGPGKTLSYYEFDLEGPRPEPGAPREFAEYVEDPALADLLCSARVEGTNVHTSIASSAAVQVLRFEGPRMLEERPHSHALFPGLEYLGPGEESSQATWTGPDAAERTIPAPHKITAPWIALEYDRERQPWVAALSWPIDGRGADGPPPAAEFCSRSAGPSYATLFRPSVPDSVAENARYAERPLPLPACAPLELELHFQLASGRLEDIFAAQWLGALPAPPGLSFADARERVRAGPGSREALEQIVCTSMLAYTRTLFDSAEHGWKTHIAIGEHHKDRPEILAAVLGESLRSGRPEYAAAVEIEPDAQIENEIGSAAACADGAARLAAARALARMSQDGGVAYEPTPDMEARIREFTRRHGSEHADLGSIGSTEPGLIALTAQPLLLYAACTRDPVFVAAAEHALARLNSFDVPRGAQGWEIHIHTPDLFAAAECVLADIWGWRIFGDVRYLDEAERWARTGLPFLYFWAPPGGGRVAAVDVADQAGEGPSQALRDPGLFYADTRREVAPFASIPAFGTSWYAVTWLGTPVQWCGLAWANAVRELDLLRPLPGLVRAADGVFRSAANQQCDRGYLAGTLPDSWEIDTAHSRQPYIIPERILEYAYRGLDAPWLDSLRYLRLDGARWTHAASRALLARVEQSAGRLVLEARFYNRQHASVLVGGRGGEPAQVLLDGRALSCGERLGQEHWIEWDAGRGALLVRWKANGERQRIEIVD